MMLLHLPGSLIRLNSTLARANPPGLTPTLTAAVSQRLMYGCVVKKNHTPVPWSFLDAIYLLSCALPPHLISLDQSFILLVCQGILDDHCPPLLGPSAYPLLHRGRSTLSPWSTPTAVVIA
ncbi:hypothetical protein BJX96DRAFT_96120 [Aspergillus floccosus]